MTLEWTSTTLRLREPFRISRGAMAERDAVTVVACDPDSELTGYGEAVTSRYADLDLRRIDTELHYVRDHLDDDPMTWRTVVEVSPAVRAAVTTARTDLHARQQNHTVAATFGLTAPRAIPILRTLGIDSPTAMADAAREARHRGFRTLKVKLDDDARLSIERLTTIADTVGDVDLIADPNEAWTVSTALTVLSECADVGLVALEQPLAAIDHRGQRELLNSTAIPVIADESIHGPEGLDDLVGLFSAVNIKLSKCGGLTSAVELAVGAHERGLDVMLGCLASSSLSIAPAAQLAGLARWCDLDGHLLLDHDPWTGLGGTDGWLRPDGTAGLGVYPTATGRCP